MEIDKLKPITHATYGQLKLEKDNVCIFRHVMAYQIKWIIHKINLWFCEDE